jgi:hypothetical protein
LVSKIFILAIPCKVIIKIPNLMEIP